MGACLRAMRWPISLFLRRREDDPTQVYFIDVHQGNPFLDTNLALTFQTGRLASSESTRIDQTAAIAEKTFEGLAKIAGTFVGVASKARPDPNAQNSKQKLLDAIEKVKNELRNVRERRAALLQSITGTDLATLQFAVNALAEEEAALIRFFTGEEKVQQIPIDLYARPTLDRKTFRLFKYSPGDGVRNGSDDSTGQFAVPSSFNSDESKIVGDVVLSIVDAAPDGELLRKQYPSLSTSDRLGYRYRIPQEATAFLRWYPKGELDANNNSNAFRELARLNTRIAQFGPVVALPESFSGRSSTIKPVLSPDTGELLSLSVGTTAIDPANISAALAAANGVIEALKAKEAAADAADQLANDPLTILKRESDELKLQKEILELRKQIEDLSKEPKS